jgi:NADH dehydrogenase FAD-containing subunit
LECTPYTDYACLDFFKIAAPRAIVDTKQIPAIFKPIADGIKQYGSSVTFVRGKASALDAGSKTVTVDEVEGGKKDIVYDSLFICTGYTTADPIWSIHDDHETSIQAIKKFNEVLPQTKTVLIAGGGPVGVETAGEIAAKFPQAKITLVSAGPILERNKSLSQKALKMLQNAKVEVLTGVRVNGTETSGTETTVQLSNGSSKSTELFVDCRGAHKINNEFIPPSWLDSTGRVTTKDGYFRVKGDGQADTTGIYVLGDIVSGSSNTAIEIDAQIIAAASSFAVDVASKRGKSTKSSGGLLSFIPGFGSTGVSQKEFKPMKDTIMVPVGPSGGVGQLMGFGVPSIMVKKAKGEKFFVNMVDPAVMGTKYAKV